MTTTPTRPRAVHPAVLNVRLPQEQRDALDLAALDAGTTVAEVVRQVFAEWIEARA